MLSFNFNFRWDDRLQINQDDNILGLRVYLQYCKCCPFYFVLSCSWVNQINVIELCDWLVQKTNLIQDCAWISHNIIVFYSVTAQLSIIIEAKGTFQKSELAGRIMAGPVILTMK